MQRFPMRLDGWVRPFLWPFGGTPARSYVEVGPEELHIKYGWAFEKRFRLDEIESVQAGKWPWWGGLGWRSNLAGRLGLVASYSGIVDVRLKRKRWTWMVLLPLPCNQLTISLEDPEAFIAALRTHLGPANS
jgi:hypothetical protein